MILPDPQEQTNGWRYLLFEAVFLPSLLITVFAGKLSGARLNFLFYLINFAVALFLMCRFLKASWSDLKRSPVKKLLIAGSGTALCFLLSLSVTALMRLTEPGFVNLNDASLKQQLLADPVLTAVGTVLLVPAAEECLFRGALFGIFRRRSAWAGYLISAGIFALVHVQGYLFAAPPMYSLLSFLQYLPVGLCLAACYEMSGNIFVPIFIHTAVNALGLAAMR